MALILADRVKETTATAGTGTVTLGGATDGFQTFGVGVGNNNTTYYTILDSNNPPTFWEVGLGTYSDVLNTLSRDIVYSSSNGGAKVDLTGVSFVFGDYPASQAVFEAKLVAGANISIVKSAANNTLTISSTGGAVTIPFTAALTAAYTTTRLPFYNSTAQSTVTYSLATNPGAPTSINLTFSDGTNTQVITSVSGVTNDFNNSGITITGSCVGNNSAGTAQTVTINQNIPAVPTFVPAFYAGASTGNTAPTFTTASSQTNNDPLNAIIGPYTQATLSTQYIWLATTYAANRVFQRTQVFGNVPITPDVTGTAQTISGTSFNIFGYTGLDTTAAITLTII